MGLEAIREEEPREDYNEEQEDVVGEALELAEGE